MSVKTRTSNKSNPAAVGLLKQAIGWSLLFTLCFFIGFFLFAPIMHQVNGWVQNRSAKQTPAITIPVNSGPGQATPVGNAAASKVEDAHKPLTVEERPKQNKPVDNAVTIAPANSNETTQSSSSVDSEEPKTHKTHSPVSKTDPDPTVNSDRTGEDEAATDMAEPKTRPKKRVRKSASVNEAATDTAEQSTSTVRKTKRSGRSERASDSQTQDGHKIE